MLANRYCTPANLHWQTATFASTYNTHTHNQILTDTNVLTHSELSAFSERRGWGRMRFLIDVCPPATLRGNQAVLHSKQRSRKNLHPNRSSSSSVSSRCPQNRQTALSCLQSPRASSTAFMVPGFAARMLCLTKRPWNGNGQAERRRRGKEDAWYLTSGRRGQMQWGGEEQRVLSVERVSQALNERERQCV